jgi:hypothetical protein
MSRRSILRAAAAAPILTMLPSGGSRPAAPPVPPGHAVPPAVERSHAYLLGVL